VFESKPIKRGIKAHFNSSKHSLELSNQMSSQFTNNYAIALTSPNLYISRKLNNMEEVQAMKKEQNDWTRLYFKELR